jgi:hypothetical protein
MSQACARWRGDIGACIVDALDRAGRARVLRHLEACAACRADYEDLLPVRDWLALLAAVVGPAENSYCFVTRTIVVRGKEFPSSTAATGQPVRAAIKWHE